jgi:hypothetical protein
MGLGTFALMCYASARLKYPSAFTASLSIAADNSPLSERTD